LVIGGVLGDLHHQLAGRRDDQRARLAHVAFFRRRGLQQLGDDRDQERGGLAGAGLGATDGVFARVKPSTWAWIGVQYGKPRSWMACISSEPV
jgi:hypothetical protein